MNSLDNLITSYTKFIVSSSKFLERIMQKQFQQKKLILFDDSEENDNDVTNISNLFIGTQEQIKNQSMMRNMLENGNSKDNGNLIQESNL